MFNLELDIDPQTLNEGLIKRVHESAEKPIAKLVSELVAEQLKARCLHYVEQGDLSRASVRARFDSWGETKRPFFLNKQTENHAVDLGDFKISVAGKSGLNLTLTPPKHLKWQETPKIKTRVLKTGCRYDIQMRWLQLRSEVLQPAKDILGDTCHCPAELLVPRLNDVWDWALQFECKVCGKTYFCSCFADALKLHSLEAHKKKSSYSREGWPWQFITKYERAKLRDGICHLCRNVPSELFYCHPMYGSPILVKYGPYIMKTSIEKQINQREAENEIRDRLGIPRIGEQWVMEVELLRIVRHLLPAEEVIHQATTKWLGRQRLDIYVPHLKLAIEYHGPQHFEPVDHFGGESGFLETQARDSRKASLCTHHGITLIFFRHDENLTQELVASRIQAAIGKWNP